MIYRQTIFYFIILVLIPILATGQDNCYKKLDHFPKEKDFSPIWLDKSFEGTIGNSNQRIQVRFLKISPDKNSSGRYLVSGKSKVNNNLCDFSGYLTVNEVFELDKSNNKCEGASYASGFINGAYELKEDINQNHVGIFKGKFSTFWVSDGGDITSYDGWYTKEGTNEFIGTWCEYNSNQNKYCSWGVQIPPTKENNLFDRYENEFYMFNNKFIDKGWKSYVYANFNRWIIIPKEFDKEKIKNLNDFLKPDIDELLMARDQEKKEWWK